MSVAFPCDNGPRVGVSEFFFYDVLVVRDRYASAYVMGVAKVADQEVVIQCFQKDLEVF